MRLALLFILSFYSISSMAQFHEWLESDRPGRSTSPTTVGSGVFQMQVGYTYEDLERVYMRTTTLYDQNNLVNARLRYGLSQKLEVSVSTRYTHFDETSDDAFTKDPYGRFDYFGFAGRYCFTDPTKDALQVGAEFEFLMSQVDEDDFKPQTRWVVSAALPLGEKFTITGNLIYSYWSILRLTANVRYAFSENLSAFVEYYPEFNFENGSRDNGREYWAYMGESYINGGIGLRLSSRLMADVSGGWIAQSGSLDADYQINGFNAQIGLTARFGDN